MITEKLYVLGIWQATVYVGEPYGALKNRSVRAWIRETRTKWISKVISSVISQFLLRNLWLQLLSMTQG